MQIVVRSPDQQWELSVPGWRTPTPGRLAERLGIEPGGRAVVDGRTLPITSQLGDVPLHMGSIVEFGPTSDGPPAPVVDLCIVAGPDSGSRLPLPPGDYALGDSEAANIVIADAGLAAVELLLKVAETGSVRVCPVPSLTEATINGHPIAGRKTLEPGSLLTLGPSGIIVRPHRADDHGLILDPSPLTDGDLFGVQLPRLKGSRLPAGRGYLVSGGEIELTQAAIA